MSFERIEVGSSPYEEMPAQVGSEGYHDKAAKECGTYKRQLLRILNKKTQTLPDNFSLFVKGFSHDFGTYYEVVCKFKTDDEASWNLYDFLEENLPSHWDDEARQELNI